MHVQFPHADLCFCIAACTLQLLLALPLLWEPCFHCPSLFLSIQNTPFVLFVFYSCGRFGSVLPGKLKYPDGADPESTWDSPASSAKPQCTSFVFSVWSQIFSEDVPNWTFLFDFEPLLFSAGFPCDCICKSWVKIFVQPLSEPVLQTCLLSLTADQTFSCVIRSLLKCFFCFCMHPGILAENSNAPVSFLLILLMQFDVTYQCCFFCFDASWAASCGLASVPFWRSHVQFSRQCVHENHQHNISKPIASVTCQCCMYWQQVHDIILSTHQRHSQSDD